MYSYYIVLVELNSQVSSLSFVRMFGGMCRLSVFVGIAELNARVNSLTVSSFYGVGLAHLITVARLPWTCHFVKAEGMHDMRCSEMLSSEIEHIRHVWFSAKFIRIEFNMRNTFECFTESICHRHIVEPEPVYRFRLCLDTTDHAKFNLY